MGAGPRFPSLVEEWNYCEFLARFVINPRYGDVPRKIKIKSKIKNQNLRRLCLVPLGRATLRHIRIDTIALNGVTRKLQAI